MVTISELEVVARLVLAAFLGGLIGLERESTHRPAGFRTHILVCVGSALVMLVSIYGFGDLRGVPFDPGRLAAQVVSGIGFLGAGTIMREGASVKGLTTAASLWVVAGIGLAAGSGYYLGAIITSILVVVVLLYLNRLEFRVFAYRWNTLSIRAADRPGQLGIVGLALGEMKVSIKKVEMLPEEEKGTVMIHMRVTLPEPEMKEKILLRIGELEGVSSAKFAE
ncbi:MAG: MgtC/SapB family protein [Syntrophothermus sp.]